MLQKILQIVFACGLITFVAAVPALAQNTGFTHQGRLADTGGNPLSGNYDFQFGCTTRMTIF